MSKDSDWRDDLWNAYPTLFEPSAPFASWIWSLPDGWRGTIEALLREIAAIVKEEEPARVVLTGLRQHRGTLEIDWSADTVRANTLVGAVVDRLRARAACSCRVCGEAAERYDLGGDAFACCAVHRPPNSDPIHPPWPLLQIRRSIEGGVSRITECRFYDREHDGWVEVDPADFGIPRSP